MSTPTLEFLRDRVVAAVGSEVDGLIGEDTFDVGSEP